MNYKKIYDEFISSRLGITPSGYYEKHHIIPKSMGGSNRSENIIKLTPRDHLFAHKLLARHYRTKGMWFAYLMMLNGKSLSSRGITGSKRDYDVARREYGDALSKNNPMKGRIYTEEEKAFLSSRSPRLSGSDHAMFGLKHSKESKEKMSKSSQRLSGRDHPMWGKTHTPEARARISAQFNRPDHPNIKTDMVSLKHADGTVFIGTRFDFRKTHEIASCGNLTSFLKGRQKSHKGWYKYEAEN